MVPGEMFVDRADLIIVTREIGLSRLVLITTFMRLMKRWILIERSHEDFD